MDESRRDIVIQTYRKRRFHDTTPVVEEICKTRTPRLPRTWSCILNSAPSVSDVLVDLLPAKTQVTSGITVSTSERQKNRSEAWFTLLQRSIFFLTSRPSCKRIFDPSTLVLTRVAFVDNANLNPNFKDELSSRKFVNAILSPLHKVNKNEAKFQARLTQLTNNYNNGNCSFFLGQIFRPSGRAPISSVPSNCSFLRRTICFYTFLATIWKGSNVKIGLTGTEHFAILYRFRHCGLAW